MLNKIVDTIQSVSSKVANADKEQVKAIVAVTLAYAGARAIELMIVKKIRPNK